MGMVLYLNKPISFDDLKKETGYDIIGKTTEYSFTENKTDYYIVERDSNGKDIGALRIGDCSEENIISNIEFYFRGTNDDMVINIVEKFNLRFYTDLDTVYYAQYELGEKFDMSKFLEEETKRYGFEIIDGIVKYKN